MPTMQSARLLIFPVSAALLILSGILLWQEQQIRDAYLALGLELTSRVTVGEWVTLGWQKP